MMSKDSIPLPRTDSLDALSDKRQFSLRSLMLAMTAIAITCGLARLIASPIVAAIVAGGVYGCVLGLYGLRFAVGSVASKPAREIQVRISLAITWTAFLYSIVYFAVIAAGGGWELAAAFPETQSVPQVVVFALLGTCCLVVGNVVIGLAGAWLIGLVSWPIVFLLLQATTDSDRPARQPLVACLVGGMLGWAAWPLISIYPLTTGRFWMGVVLPGIMGMTVPAMLIWAADQQRRALLE